jgi:ribonuclease P protein component
VTDGELPAGKSVQYALPRAARITASEEIRTLFRRGKRRKTRHLDVFVSASPVPRSRIGLVVPKPRKKTSPDGKRIRAAAVQRNRLKRRLREIARTELLPSLPCNADVLVRARPEAYGASFDSLREELSAIQEWLCSSVR